MAVGGGRARHPHADGTAVITKPVASGGRVSVSTEPGSRIDGVAACAPFSGNEVFIGVEAPDRTRHAAYALDSGNGDALDRFAFLTGTSFGCDDLAVMDLLRALTTDVNGVVVVTDPCTLTGLPCVD